MHRNHVSQNCTNDSILLVQLSCVFFLRFLRGCAVIGTDACRFFACFPLLFDTHCCANNETYLLLLIYQFLVFRFVYCLSYVFFQLSIPIENANHHFKNGTQLHKQRSRGKKVNKNKRIAFLAVMWHKTDHIALMGHRKYTLFESVFAWTKW